MILDSSISIFSDAIGVFEDTSDLHKSHLMVSVERYRIHLSDTSVTDTLLILWVRSVMESGLKIIKFGMTGTRNPDR